MKLPDSISFALIKTLLISAAIILVILIQARYFEPALIRNVELIARDLSQNALARDTPNQQIVLIDIDEPSIELLGQWPWSRNKIAELIENLLSKGVEIVALDIVLSGSQDTTGNLRILDLAKSRKLVLAQVFDYAKREQPIKTGTLAGDISSYDLGTDFQPTRATGFVGNHEELKQSPCVGNIGFIPDADGKIRSLPLVTQIEERFYPSLPLAVLLCQNRIVPKNIFNSNAQRLRFKALPGSWSVISAGDIFSRPSDPDILNRLDRKIAVIGSSALGLSDRVATPLAASVSGMVVHASAISELSSGHSDSVSEKWLPEIGIFLVLVTGMLFRMTLSPALQLVSICVVFSIWIGTLFFGSSMVSDTHLTAPIWGMLLLGATLLPLQWLLARSQTHATVELLSRYVARPLLEELLRQRNFNPLKPRHAKITVLVADMTDYTSIVSTQNLEATAVMIREFLECLTASILDTRGTVDSYRGDGLLAFWGAPLESSNQAEMAVTTAIKILQRVRELSAKFCKNGLPPVSVRIGIASGYALVGDLGTEYRAAYTAIGSCVNLASRLERKAKELGEAVVIAENVSLEVMSVNLKSLGSHEIRGVGPVELYAVSLKNVETCEILTFTE